ncbi:MAG: S8 family serine peptidase [Deltaproteobacteria bacterium]|nr:S8 family serine peptidase [Deltaproteobacteria bacterium]
MTILFCLGIWVSASAAEVVHSSSPMPVTEVKQSHVDGGLDTVTVHDGLVSLNVHAVSLKELLKKIAETARIDLAVDPKIEEKVTHALDDVPLDKALKELCRSRAMIYQYNAKTKVYRIVGLSVQKSGDAERQTSVADTKDPDDSTQTKALSETSVASPGQEENLFDSRGRLLYKPRELLVKFKKTAAGEDIAALHRTLGSTLISAYEYRRLHRVKIKEGLPLKEAADQYRASPLVDRVERHALRYGDSALPNDSNFNLQWGLHNVGQYVNGLYGRTDADIDAPEAWDITDRDKEIVIAVIDTGMDYNHPDLAGRIWINPGEVPNNNIDDDENGYIDDVRGWDFAGSPIHPTEDNDPLDHDNHGTHVAGIIGALKNNGLGVAGIFPKARIMVLKVSKDGEKDMDMFNIISALDYARSNGARIINCSIGGSTPSQGEYEALADLKSAGILAVCAAGNDQYNLDISSTKNYPACYAHSLDPAYPPLDNIIAVAASNQTDGLWSSDPTSKSGSNYGSKTVDLMAPGVNVRSTALNDGYVFNTGTSMAAPHVTAVAGLVLSRDPNLTYLQVKETILTHVDENPNPDDPVSGMLITRGRLNAFKALASIHLPGDLNGDHKIGPADMILGLQIVSGTAPAYSWVSADDINQNGNIGLEEVIYMMQWVARLRGNSPPVMAAFGNKSVPENMTLSFSVWATDEDGDVLTYSAAGLPAGASFYPGTKTFTWTPTYSQSGVYPVTFTVEDGNGGLDAKTISITVIDAQPVFKVADYFPLNIGDWWDYDKNATGVIERTSVTGTKWVNGVLTKIMEDANGSKEYYTADGVGIKQFGGYLIEEDFTGEVIYTSPLLLMQDNATVGTVTSSSTQFSFVISERTYHVNITTATTILGIEDVMTQNTVLRDCIKVSTQITQYIVELQRTVEDIEYIWFYKGVGPVKESSSLGDTYVITASNINGTVIHY